MHAYLDQTLNRCVAWFRASGGSIFLRGDADIFELRSRVGFQRSLPCYATIEPGKGIAGIVAASGVGRIIDDPSTDPELAGVANNSDIASAMVVPLLDTKRRTIGVLNISRQAGEQPFREPDLDQVTALAAHLALAVSNAQLVSKLQESLDESRLANEKISAVLDSVSGAIVVVDRHGNVVNHNQAAAAQSFLDATEGDGITKLAALLNEATDLIIDKQSSLSGRAFDEATDRTWLVESTPLASGGGVITVQEITEHERQSRELDRVKRLAEIGQMTAAIAHEIRNPLTGIRSAAQMIRQHPDTMPEFIGAIEEESMRLNALCDEFLEFSRPMALNYQETDLSTIAAQVAKLVEHQFAEKGVKLACNLDSDPPTMCVDGRRVSQVLHNLLRNALDASEPGQEVLLTTRGAKIAVRDNGQGMDETNLQMLFSPFFTTKPDGTGLGLSVSRKVIDAHGGDISVTTSLGNGCQFEVNLESCLA